MPYQEDCADKGIPRKRELPLNLLEGVCTSWKSPGFVYPARCDSKPNPPRIFVSKLRQQSPGTGAGDRVRDGKGIVSIKLTCFHPNQIVHQLWEELQVSLSQGTLITAFSA